MEKQKQIATNIPAKVKNAFDAICEKEGTKKCIATAAALNLWNNLSPQERLSMTIDLTAELKHA